MRGLRVKGERLLEALVAEVREATVRPERLTGVEAEIFYDTRISGDDFYELIEKLAWRFGTDFSSMDASNYVPGESFDPREVLLWINKRPFKSLKVADLYRAIERGSWGPSQGSQPVPTNIL